jgi:hypothetical protein
MLQVRNCCLKIREESQQFFFSTSDDIQKIADKMSEPNVSLRLTFFLSFDLDYS